MPGRILLVDDEPNVIKALKRSLRCEHYRIFTAGSALEAFDVLDSEVIDVVISDEKMPGMSGSEFLSVVRQLYPHTARIILTGQATVEAAKRAINEGKICCFLTKPWDHDEMVRAVREAIGDMRYRAETQKVLDLVKRKLKSSLGK